MAVCAVDYGKGDVTEPEDMRAGDGDQRRRQLPPWWSPSWRPRTLWSAVLAALVVFVLLTAFGRLLLHGTWRTSVMFPAALALLSVARDLRWIQRGCPD